MGMVLLHDDTQAELFISHLRRSSKTPYSEQMNNQLYTICLESPNALPLIVVKLEDLKLGPDYRSMIAYLDSSGLGFVGAYHRYFSHAIRESMQSLTEALFHAQKDGHEGGFLSVLINAMQHTMLLHEQWLVMKNGVVGLKKFGHYRRAQNLSFVAYYIAQLLEDEALMQRSGFSILHSTRMVGNADLRGEYLRECKKVKKGSLLYTELNQCLVPIYASMHFMDLQKGEKIVRKLLKASDDYLLYDFARLNNKIAWARYNFLSGRTHPAKRLVHELTEQFDLSIIDAPVMDPLLSLATKIGVDMSFVGQPSITPAPQALWHRFDVALENFCERIELNRQQSGNFTG